MHVFYTPDIASNLELPEEEAGHCLRVLRLSIGDEIMLTDGKGCFYKAVISAASGKRCQVKVTETIPQEKGWFEEDGPSYPIRVAFLKDVATIGIDTTGVSLHKRGYRQLTSKAPITELIHTNGKE